MLRRSAIVVQPSYLGPPPMSLRVSPASLGVWAAATATPCMHPTLPQEPWRPAHDCGAAAAPSLTSAAPGQGKPFAAHSDQLGSRSSAGAPRQHLSGSPQQRTRMLERQLAERDALVEQLRRQLAAAQQQAAAPGQQSCGAALAARCQDAEERAKRAEQREAAAWGLVEARECELAQALEGKQQAEGVAAQLQEQVKCGQARIRQLQAQAAAGSGAALQASPRRLRAARAAAGAGAAGADAAAPPAGLLLATLSSEKGTAIKGAMDSISPVWRSVVKANGERHKELLVSGCRGAAARGRRHRWACGHAHHLASMVCREITAAVLFACHHRTLLRPRRPALQAKPILALHKSLPAQHRMLFAAFARTRGETDLSQCVLACGHRLPDNKQAKVLSLTGLRPESVRCLAEAVQAIAATQPAPAPRGGAQQRRSGSRPAAARAPAAVVAAALDGEPLTLWVYSHAVAADGQHEARLTPFTFVWHGTSAEAVAGAAEVLAVPLPLPGCLRSGLLTSYSAGGIPAALLDPADDGQASDGEEGEGGEDGQGGEASDGEGGEGADGEAALEAAAGAAET